MFKNNLFNLSIKFKAEFVILLLIAYKLISYDLSFMSGFITRNFNRYVELQERRNNITKYVQLLFIKILNDTQYGESMINLIKQVINHLVEQINKHILFLILKNLKKNLKFFQIKHPEKYKNFNHNLTQKLNFYETFVANIWRSSPESKDQAVVIYKTNHLANNIVEESKIRENGLYYNFENRFPVLPSSSISYFSVKDIREINFTKLFNKFMEIDTDQDYLRINFFILFYFIK